MLIYPHSKQSCIFETFIKISSKNTTFAHHFISSLGELFKKSFEALSWKTELTHFSKFMISCNATDLEPSECSYCSRLQITTNRKYKGKGRAQAEKDGSTSGGIAIRFFTTPSNESLSSLLTPRGLTGKGLIR